MDISSIFHRLDNNTSQIESGQIATIFNLNLRYEFNYKVLGIKDRLTLFLGASAEPYLELINVEPIISTSFDTKNQYLGSKVYITPRITYDFSKRFYIDLNFPIELANFYWNSSKIENPTLPEDIQKSTKFNSDYFNEVFRFRLGIGVKI